MIDNFTHHIGVLKISLHIPHAQSLKDKRMVIKSIKDRVRSKFNVSVSELDHQDKWQLATLAFAMIGNDNRYMDSCLQNILSLIESTGTCNICETNMEFR